MILTTAMLRDQLSDYADSANKIARMVSKGELTPIVRGLYETDPHAPSCALAACIYGPSYVSFEYALAFYGLIPEAVYAVTSATFEKRKKKQYNTAFGKFLYRDVPSRAFPFGLQIREEAGYSFRIATPEKALCDQVYAISPVANLRDMDKLLLEDLRIDTSDLRLLDCAFIEDVADLYASRNVSKLASYLRRLK